MSRRQEKCGKHQDAQGSGVAKETIVNTAAAPSSGPYLHANIYTPRIMWEASAALAPAFIAAWYFFGIPALITTAWCIGSCMAGEALFDLTYRRRPRVMDGSAFLTGLLLAFNLPPSTPWYVCVSGSFVAVVAAKGIFGGLGKNIFNPALAARAFCMAAFPMALGSYTLTVKSFTSLDAIAAATPLLTLKFRGFDALASDCGGNGALLMQLLTGDRSGCIGETSIIALCIGGVFLLWRGIISWHIPVSMIVAAGTVALIIGHHPLYALVHVLSGGLVLGAFFMATDYITSPTYPLGKIIFGAGCGIILMIIRLYGVYPEGCMFSILIMNIFSPLIDRLTVPRRYGVNKRK
jgi:electron transport complex protein RnfD